MAAFQKNLMSMNAAVEAGAINPQKYKQAQRAVNVMSDNYRAAAASSGLLHAQQVKINSQAKEYTQLLEKQKLGMMDMLRTRKTIMKDVFEDQIRMRRMTVTSRGTDRFGREIMDVTTPARITKDMSSWGDKMRFFNTQLQSAGTQMINLGKNVQWAGRQLTVGLTYPMVLFAGAAGKMAYDVDKQFTRIAKVYDSTLGKEASTFDKARESQQLRTESMAMGRRMAEEYGASITEVLKVEAALAATGLSGEKLLTSTKETVRIASLGEVDFTQATDMTIALQTAFSDTIKTSQDLTEAFDFMNAVENATSLSIQDIAEATPRAASALAGLGVTVEEMTILLTSMRAAGIDAAEGANALKSVSARIINPGIWKGAQPFFDGFANIEEISKQSGGNLYKFITLLGKAVKDMPTFEKQQGISKLFGAYQFSRGAAALKGITDAVFGLGDANSQVARAIEVQMMPAQERAAIAAGELAKQQQSASGQMKRAWEELKITFAEIGQAFLPVGTMILRIIEDFMSAGKEMFNALPEWGRGAAIAIAAIAGIAGPLIMTAGIIGNLMGWITKGLGMLVAGGRTMKMLTVEQKAAEMQALRNATATQRQASAVKILTGEIIALTAAQEYSIASAKAMMAGGAAGAMGGPAFTSVRSANDIRQGLGIAAVPLPGNLIEKTNKKGRTQYRRPDGGFASKEEIAAHKAANAERAKSLGLEKEIRESRVAQNKASLAGKPTLEENEKILRKTSVSGGILQATLLGSMFAGGKLGTTLMMVSTALLAAQAANGLFGEKLKSAWKVGEGGIGKFGGKASGMFANISKKAAAFGSVLLGPWGLAAAAIAGVGFLTYKWIKKIYDEPERRQEKINNATKDWVKTLGVVQKKHKDINWEIDRYAGTTTTQMIADKFKKTEGGEALIKELGEGGDIADQAVAIREYVRLLKETNATAIDAQQAVEAMFIAAGDSATEAASKVDEIVAAIGDHFDVADLQRVWGRLFESAMDGVFRTVDEKAKGLAMSVRQALESAGGPGEREEILVRLKAVIDGKNYNLWVKDFKSDIAELQREGIDGEAVTKAVMSEFFAPPSLSGPPGSVGWIKDMASELDVTEEQIGGIVSKLMDMSEAQKSSIQNSLEGERLIIESLKQELGIKGEINSIDELMATREAIVHTTSKENLRERLQLLKDAAMAELALIDLMPGVNDGIKDAAEEQALVAINAIRTAHNLQEVKNIADALDGSIEAAVGAQKAHTSEAQRTASALQKAISAQNKVRDIAREGMSGATNAVADAALEGLQAQQAAQTAALDASITAHSNALDRQADNADAHYDRLIEKTEAFYDRRIKRINDEIAAEEKANDTRKRLFDAEITRMQRLAEFKNRNIDVNMAVASGNFDEAAKLMNDAEAQQISNLFEDETKKADAALEGRRASLEKQIDILERQRELKVKALEDDREAKRRAIDNAKQRWDAEAQIRKDALAKEQADKMANYQKGLELLRAYIPKDKQQLLNHMAELDKKYGIFGGELVKKSDFWSGLITREIVHATDVATRKMRSEVDWSAVGFVASKEIMEGIASGLGISVGKLRQWLGMGKPKQDVNANEGKGAGFGPGTGDPADPTGTNPFWHRGGPIGGVGQGSGRGGKYAGSRSAFNEVPLIAERGEYMVQKDAVNKYGTDFFDSVNKGEFGTGGPTAGYGAAAKLAAAATVGAVASRMTQKVVEKIKKSGHPGAPRGPLGALGDITALKAGKYGNTNLDGEQLKHAAIIAREGKSMGMSSRDIVIGLMTAMQESMLRNVNYGDRDSLGLFQQRPSMGWGTPAQVTDPVYASRKFFSTLKGVEDRDKMPLTLAAQAVQRSAFPYAYAKWEDEARAIMGAWSRAGGGGGTSGGFVQGTGGRHRPVRGGVITNGLHPYNAIDIGVPVGTPVYAAADGRVVTSKDLTTPGGGYRSYGRYITIDHGGFETLYAHLSQRAVGAGAVVRGGARIGASGNTGNSTGPHLHFGAPGSNPYNFVSLRKGGEVRWDNTMANLHRGETVLTAPLTKAFKENVATGSGSGYSITIDLRGAYVKEEIDIKKAVYEAIDEKEAKVGRKRIVK